ncbi:putative Hsp70 nucleotide exchange factor [Massariosphaeria phaeospora]|uniref:Putative Hsp70 nucleotide exchange factor n=1 Tax=Massariosphaeria phaeospora TaxID=100035 RepID=A0A7C8IFQ5_9PLEO|nr:putative Hsp70 nucleotide exchange factor [Massariosphaeria phaeospora]
MSDPAMNSLLRWSVENSEASQTGIKDRPHTQLSPEGLRALLVGVVSDTKMMRESMAVVQSDNADNKIKVQAFDNLLQLVEHIDNANNLEPLKLWTPLVAQLEHPEAEIRSRAAWCCAIAVQNNIKSQERILVLGAIPTLARMAIQDPEQLVRKKSILALSSIVRNFQPGLDIAVSHLPEDLNSNEKLDATDMDSVDSLISKLRANA